ncbi:hypothetical protein Q5H93_12050 [Hymenobacter sp. ASUV-10]|uniref:STAS domain-containing protein n=1 Tax=Hymenobacter aranciens TaxID=3063996 RepID=A0ABT9BB25_9BACT|nr:hypothetical protein [Hymenobacter sp. ASUV-10]MDO7875466.1 hypothetical protein [Hymenobacter sp. ASUV-10]
MSIPQSNVPGSDFGGMRRCGRAGAVAGLLAFLLALPLGMAIGGASWFPPLAGIAIAIVGGVAELVAGRFGLSIRWSIAGLLVVAVGAAEELSRGGAGRGHHLALATTVVASVAAGGLATFIFQLYQEAPARSLFTVSAGTGANAAAGQLLIIVHNSLVARNYFSLKSHLDTLPAGQHIIIDLGRAKLVDYTAFESLRHFQNSYAGTGGRVELVGLQAAPHSAVA